MNALTFVLSFVYTLQKQIIYIYIYIYMDRTKHVSGIYALKLFIEHSGDISCSLLS